MQEIKNGIDRTHLNLKFSTVFVRVYDIHKAALYYTLA